MITILTYDGSFEGFLTAVFECYEYKITQPEIIPHYRNNDFLFAETHRVITQTDKAERVLQKLANQLGKEGIQDLLFAFLSEEEQREKNLLQVIQYAVQQPYKNVLFDFSNPYVAQVKQWSKSVWRERHRVEAFVRFEKLNNEVFVAVIEPDFDVLSVTIKHFIGRFQDQKWIIIDLKRQYGYYYDTDKTDYFTIENQAKTFQQLTQQWHVEEAQFQKLWQQYFKSTSIASRKNTKLHVQHVPKRYWKYLTEKKTT